MIEILHKKVQVSIAPRHSYRPEIDGMRALAVIAVIINHCNKELLPSGYLGVDIFFAISGFVITASLANRSSKNFGDFVTGFYARRLKRLVPALVLFVLIVSLLICLFNPRPDASIKTGITALFGLSNLYLLRQATDYFAASTELNIFTHTWSLGVEEQFYFLFPFLVWFTGFSRQADRQADPQISENFGKGSRNLFWAMSVLSLASLIAFVGLYEVRQSTAYFLMPTRLWELGSGCLLFLGLKSPNQWVRTLETISPWIVTGAIVAVLFVPLQFAVQATVAVVMLTLVLIGCLRFGTGAYRLFTHPKVVYIGLISYSLYLWHWGVLCLSRWTIGIYWWSVPFQLALMLLLAIASYRYVEVPLRRSNWSAIRWRSIAYGAGASVSVAVLLMALVKMPDSFLYTGRVPSLLEEGSLSLRDAYSLTQGDVQTKLQKGLRWGGRQCILAQNSDAGKKILVENCTLGDFANTKRRIMVIGDSFGASFIEAFDELVVSDGYAVTLTSCWAASVVKEIPNTTEWADANNYYWQSVVPPMVARLKPGDLVFMMNDLSDFSPKHPTSETSTKLKQLKTGLEVFSDQLAAKNIKLAILHGNPFAREANCQPVVASKQWFSLFGGPCKLPTRSESLARREPLNEVLVALEREEKLRIVDLFNVYCPDETCTYNAKNGQILYRDEHSHTSVEGARLAAPIIRKALLL
jgi:peptidoglycan/LPS O-acetylase OafA/YrhL